LSRLEGLTDEEAERLLMEGSTTTE
jgi:hypothetical protein